MDNVTQDATTTTKTLSITDENISQADYERLRAGETVEVEEKSAPAKEASETVDESDPSKLEAKGDADEESEVEETEDEALEAAKPKKKSGTQRRIEKLVKQRTEAERQVEYWREQALKAQGQKPESNVEATKVIADGEPKEDDFETAVDFYRAHAKWAAKQEIETAKKAEQEAKLKAEKESKATAFQGKVQEFKKTHEDFDDVVSDVDDVPMSLAVQQAILESDDGPGLMYELAKNRDEYERICSLPAIQAAIAIGRFEAGLAKASEEKKLELKTKTTKAPPPARPVSATSANGKLSAYDADKMTQAQYERLRDEQEKRRRAY